MTQEEKDLLLKDICSRIPYEVVGKCEIDASYDTSFDTVFQTHKFDAVVYGLKEDLLFVTPLIEDMDEQEFANEEVADGIDILDVKPYLFPLSSMTKEQKEELKYLCDWGNDRWSGLVVIQEGEFCMNTEIIDWLNKNHFDYNRLIEKSLALDATGLDVY